MSLSDLMAELGERLNQTEDSLALVKAEDNSTNSKLDALRDDAQKLQRTVQDLLDQVEFIKNSDIRGKYRGEPSHNIYIYIYIHIYTEPTHSPHNADVVK